MQTPERNVTVKTVYTYATPLTNSVKLSMSITATENVPRNLFVLSNIAPGLFNKDNKTVFCHVAYMDELDNTPEILNSDRSGCIYRSSSFSKIVSSPDKAKRLKDSVLNELKRLLLEMNLLRYEGVVSIPPEPVDDNAEYSVISSEEPAIDVSMETEVINTVDDEGVITQEGDDILTYNGVRLYGRAEQA